MPRLLDATEINSRGCGTNPAPDGIRHHKQTTNYMALTYNSGSPSASSFSVEAGTYKLRVIEATEDTSKGGNDMVKLKLRILKADGSDGPAMFDYLVLGENTGWKIDQFLSACGEHPGEGQRVSLDVDAMIGWECEAELTVETYNGKKSNKVANYVIQEF